ncbi:uncharacterized protein THITE_2106371 [Thermothielavioides terrestris NRRL 8126]|uniref:Uncharacterized protein n=1 Tax=Thermothielavioides terrestris (strain ATCC 38088 / NRRL 8126) TaxID=578455 RepID=G2QX97_THETT|nr:uncharacterized protein THITE_2106371 [Thermothielavioides terrestris NRRL 8126]AEO62318.1 hypothetical protein THITE_2106371 [Thermothielavioides terrestris NRRL 8126]
MADAVRLSAEKFREIYEQSFRAWSGIGHDAAEQPGLPHSYLDLQSAFRHYPSFPRNLRLKHVKYARHSQVYATGRSAWGSTKSDCAPGLPSFCQQVEISVVSRSPIPVSVRAASEEEIQWGSWFARGDENYLAVLSLAWAYILSARWVETMPEDVSLVYTSSTADVFTPNAHAAASPDQLNVLVDIGDAGPGEARWWAAILAPGQGWRATMSMGGDAFLAPWSIQLQPACRFLLSTTTDSKNIGTHSAVPPSSSEALRFLGDFCARHNIADQSQAALAAVLLFPSMRTGQGLQLPAPAISGLGDSMGVASPSVLQPKPHGWAQQADDLDRLLTLSCHTRGIRPMLLSSFYDPNIECNAVTPWLQGALAAIAVVARDDPLILARMLMDRQPKVAPLWLGVAVLGLQKDLLKDVGFGYIPVDLHSAAWSGTVQSFIQLPVSDPVVADGRVARADQCRLLYLSRSGSHDRVPICQWRPFGETPLEHTDIEIRNHAECQGHGLRYQGFTWDCVDGGTATQQPLDGDDAWACPSPLLASQPQRSKQAQVIDYGKLDIKKDFVSENATRSIFSWLRVDGFASDEKDIWTHEWFEACESDEEVEMQSKGSSVDMARLSSCVETWVSELPCDGSRSHNRESIPDSGNQIK